MNKTTKIIIAIVAIAIVAVIAVTFVMGSKSTKEKSNLPEINRVDDLIHLANKVYEGVSVEMYSLETRNMDLSDATTVKYNTGLENGEDLEYAVISEPMMNTQPYSFILAKVKEGVNANEIAKTMSDNIDTRKWICVSAEKLFATNSGDLVCLVMSDEEKASSVFESFKALAGTVGEVYEKTTEDGELPPDTVPEFSIPVPQS